MSTNVLSGVYTNLTETNITTNQDVTGGGSGAIQGNNGLSQTITGGQGSTVNIDQTSPGALAALSAATSGALNLSLAETQAGMTFASMATKSALETAAAATRPESQTTANLVKTVAIAGAIVLAVYFYMRKG